MRALGTSWLGNAGYRSYEGITRVEMVEAATAAAVLGAGSLAVGADPARFPATFAVAAVFFGAAMVWGELRRLRRGLSTARIGALPPGERPLDELAREWRSLPVSVVLRVAGFAALAALAQLAFDSLGHWLLFTGSLTAGHAVSQAAVLVWLRRRRRRDGMELHVRDAEGDQADDPPRLLLVPRGS